MIWKEKPLTRVKKGSWAQVGRKVQSPILGTGVTHIWPIYGFDMVLIWHKSRLGGGGDP